MPKSILNVSLLFLLQTGENDREKEVRERRKRRLYNVVKTKTKQKAGKQARPL